MLSRTAGELFWLGRYVERADNMTRLIQAGQRLETLIPAAQRTQSEWSAVLTAAGCEESFPGVTEQAGGQEAMAYLVLDPANLSSIFSCFRSARDNARAQRGSITHDMWLAIDGAWRAVQRLRADDLRASSLADTLEAVRGLTARFRGSWVSTMLRDARFSFLSAGRYLERADATARLLDVKYHLLMPPQTPVGSGLDRLHWHAILHAAGARTAYRWVYRSEVDYRYVVDFLLLNSQTPRSFSFALKELGAELERLHGGGSQRHASLLAIRDLMAHLAQSQAEDLIALGLHEALTELVEAIHHLADLLASDFGFGPLVTESQSS